MSPFNANYSFKNDLSLKWGLHWYTQVFYKSYEFFASPESLPSAMKCWYMTLVPSIRFLFLCLTEISAQCVFNPPFLMCFLTKIRFLSWNNISHTKTDWSLWAITTSLRWSVQRLRSMDMTSSDLLPAAEFLNVSGKFVLWMAVHGCKHIFICQNHQLTLKLTLIESLQCLPNKGNRHARNNWIASVLGCAWWLSGLWQLRVLLTAWLVMQLETEWGQGQEDVKSSEQHTTVEGVSRVVSRDAYTAQGTRYISFHEGYFKTLFGDSLVV